MAINELANIPVDITLGGKTFKVSRLSTKELFGNAQAKVISDYNKNIMTIASSLSGQEKTNFLVQSLKEIPSGAILNQMANEHLATLEGMTSLYMVALNKHQKVSEEEVVELLLRAKEEETVIAMARITGSTEEQIKEQMEEDNGEKK